jgi:hypothetical protein
VAARGKAPAIWADHDIPNYETCGTRVNTPLMGRNLRGYEYEIKKVVFGMTEFAKGTSINCDP